jgi:hypothetical protein
VFTVLQYDLLLAVFCAALLMVAITLAAFTGQQMYYISRNRTQVELDKIETIEEQWEVDGIKKKYVHAYDHGLLRNWVEFLFPERMQLREPKDYTEEWEAQEQKRQEKENVKEKQE